AGGRECTFALHGTWPEFWPDKATFDRGYAVHTSERSRECSAWIILGEHDAARIRTYRLSRCAVVDGVARESRSGGAHKLPLGAPIRRSNRGLAAQHRATAAMRSSPATPQPCADRGADLARPPRCSPSCPDSASSPDRTRPEARSRRRGH